MPLLTDSDLACMRATLEDSLPDTATIKTRTQTTDDYGGEGEVWGGTATTTCRISFAGDDVAAAFTDQPVGAGVDPQQLYVVTLPYGTAINKTDRLVINGTTYDVVSDADKTRSEQISKRLLVKAI